MEALGSQSEYVNIDLGNAIKLKETIAKIRNRYGRVDALFQLADLSKKGLDCAANITANFLNFNFVKESGLYAARKQERRGYPCQEIIMRYWE